MLISKLFGHTRMVTCQPLTTPRRAKCKGREQCPSRKLATLNARIADTERVLSGLQGQRLPIKTEMNDVHDTLLSQLPIEVVSHIFTFCTPTMADACHAESYRIMSPAPLNLGAVCYAWRSIAWATPKLWSSIAVNICREDLLRLVSLAEEWLDRSGTLPLTISLYSRFYKDDYLKRASSHTMYFLNGIKRRSRRWQHLSLEMPHNYVFQLCDNRNIDEPTDLQSLYIHRIDQAPPIQCPVLRLNARHSPRCVTLRDIEFKYLDIKWKNLTYLRVDEQISLTTCLDILNRVPKLEHFGFSFNGHNVDNVQVPSFLTHQALRSLQYRANSPMYLADAFLLIISLPSLEEVDYDAQMFQLPVQSIISIVAGSLVGVWKLFLSVDYSCDNRALDILRETPSVTDLTLNISQSYGNLLDIVGNLFQALLETKQVEENGVEKHTFLPRLRSLMVVGPVPRSWATVSAIANRQSPSSISQEDPVKFRPLRTLTFFIDKYCLPSSDDLMSFIDLRREGVILNIFQSSKDNFGTVHNHDLISDYEQKQSMLCHTVK